MTPEELSQLEELDRTAMPGPWRLTTQMGIPGEGTVYGIKCGVGYQMTGFGRPEAEMLVVMRNALPGLLREIREQAVTIESLQADIDRLKAALVNETAQKLFYERSLPGLYPLLSANRKAELLAESVEWNSKRFPDLFKEAGK